MRLASSIALSFAVTFVWSMFSLADEPVIKVDPLGKPRALSKGQAIRYGVWFDAEGWHLRTDTGGKVHEFTGVIDVVGGKVTSIFDFDGLEAGGKKGKSDFGMLNQAKNQISYKFRTGKGRDGFDFRVDDAATEIRFTLLIDGLASPERVLIGAKGQPAPAKIFSLPASPQQP